MPKSELSRERENIMKIIKRGEARNVKFNIPIDINSASLAELKELHKNIYDYATTYTEDFTLLKGQDVKKYENKKRTAHARGKETLSIDYEVPLDNYDDEIYDQIPGEYDFDKTPDYDTEYDTDTPPQYETVYTDIPLPEDLVFEEVIQNIKDLANSFNPEASDFLINEVYTAIANIGQKKVALNMLHAKEDILDNALVVARYWDKKGKNAVETKLSAYQNFLSCLYANSPAENTIKAKEAAAKGSQLYTKMTRKEPPKGAATFGTKEAGLALEYKRFWYKDEDDNWQYYDSRSKKNQ